MSINPNEVLAAIVRGELDDQLDEIEDAIHNRDKTRRVIQSYAMTPGTRVRLVHISPKFLSGYEGVIERRERTRFAVRLDIKSAYDKMRLTRYLRPDGTVLVTSTTLELA